MTLRLSGFILILSILGLSGYAALDQARRGVLGPAEGISEAERKAELAGARSVLAIVGSQLEQVKAVTGTYDSGLDLDNFPHVRLAHADESSYCLEFEKTATFFRRGPGGSTAIGSC